MALPTSEICGDCDHPAAPAPRLTVRQDRHYDCPVQYEIGLCAEPACLGCNAALSPGEGETSVRCAARGKTNVLGSTLGSPAIVRLG